MLSVSKPMAASQAGRYFEKDDYYLAEKGQWLGKGAESLELKDNVVKEAFNNLALGKDPSGGSDLVFAKGDTHRAGIDLTFSAPKSVSILSLADQSVKTLHDQAVKNTIDYVEKYYSQARETQNKETKVISTGNLVIAKFDHATSRELDPQLHSHCFVMNMTQRSDGEWRAAHNDLIYKDQKELGRIYRNELANELQKAGYAIEITDRQNSFFEIKGVSRDLIESFSQRRQQIEEKVKELRNSNEYKNSSEARLYEIAALGSRSAKKEVSKEDLKTLWNGMIRSQGQSLQGIKDAVLKESAALKEVITPGEMPKPNEYEYLKIASKIITENESVIHKKAVLDMAVKLSLGEYAVQTFDSAFNELSKDKTLIALGTQKDSKGNIREVYTTPEMRRIEKQIIASVNSSKDRWQAISDSESVKKLISNKEQMQGWNFTDGQKKYITTVLTSKDGVNIIQGDAGSGKTAGASVIREFAEAQGYTVLGVGYTGKAAQELQSVGIKSKTIDSFLASKSDIPESKTIMLIDEASMVGSKQGMLLLDRLKAADSKVVIIGDIKQFQSISAGRLLSELQKRTSVDKVEMKEVLRQKTEHMKEVVKALNDPAGMDTDKALDVLDKKGNLVEISDRDSRIQEVIKTYLSETAKNKDTLVLTETNKDRIEINERVRNELIKEGRIEDGLRFKILTTASISSEIAAVADTYKPGQFVVVTNKVNDKITTGITGHIERIDRNKNTVTFANSDEAVSQTKLEINLTKHFDKISIFNDEERQFAAGDKIVFLKNDSEVKVQNGLQGVIKSIDHRGNVTVETKNGHEVRFNISENDAIKGDSKNKYNYIDHAYAVTEYKSQGATVENSIWLVEKGNSNALYVAATRAKEDFKIFTSNRDELIKNVGTSQEKTSTLDYGKDSLPDSNNSKGRSLERSIGLEIN